jgi:uncharacterized protein
MPLLSAPDPRQSVELLLIQPTPFCNINCRYCYLHHRARKARMSEDVIGAIAGNIVAGPLVADEFSLCWHGGEPLSVPISWYEHACDLLESAVPTGRRLVQHVQTNAMLIDDEWIKFFPRYGWRIGVSIDGPRHIHDANRVDRRGEGSFNQTIRGIERLREARVPFDVIAVLTAGSLDEPDALFDFFLSLGVRSLGFNIDEIEGPHQSSSLAGADAASRLKQFLLRFFARHAEAGEPFLLRPLEQLRAAVAGRHRREGLAFNDQIEPLAIVVVSVDGAMSTFSPELIGNPNTEFGNFVFGNVRDGGPEIMLSNRHLLDLRRRIERGCRRCAKSCGYYDLCLGGAPGNKYFETGRFDVDETLYCRLSVKTMIEASLLHLESLIH